MVEEVETKGFEHRKKQQQKVFSLVSEFKPSGDQAEAIEQLVAGVESGMKSQVLLGVTGSGKTFTICNVVARVNKPTLVLAHNKTLAAQLYQEIKEFFPDNAVEYFVSYYDYYQPEAYVPSSDTFIEKDAQINDAIDRLRHSATRSLLERDDVIIVASVSCIYGIGSKDSYGEMTAYVEVGRSVGRDSFLRQLVESQYQRNDMSFHRGTFRVRGDVVEVFPAHEEETALRIIFFGDEVEEIHVIDPLRGKSLKSVESAYIWPASHYVANLEKRSSALKSIRQELLEQLQMFRKENLLLEEQRLEQRTAFDLEMLEGIGICKGIENYSRHLSGSQPGEPPSTLLDYFPRDFLLVLDESHQTVPQVRAMYKGDRSRKETLVRHGFRLPSAMDNRPLKFEEFYSHINQIIYVSATPADYELDEAEGVVVEQIIRPTGLLDPALEIRPVGNQVDDLLEEIHKVVAAGERILVTTLTKRMSEDLSEYLKEVGVKARYMHSDIDTLERIAIITALRRGEYDVLVGINLLREGLDIPEVSLVAIFDADKEGFLRSATGLIQTIGRAARNVNGRAILYADRITESMKIAIDETERRRKIQDAYNKKHRIIPTGIKKKIHGNMSEDQEIVEKSAAKFGTKKGQSKYLKLDDDQLLSANASIDEVTKVMMNLRSQMLLASEELEFEKAAALRDQIRQIESQFLTIA